MMKMKYMRVICHKMGICFFRSYFKIKVAWYIYSGKYSDKKRESNITAAPTYRLMLFDIMTIDLISFDKMTFDQHVNQV
jgi:hypothetical protein